MLLLPDHLSNFFNTGFYLKSAYCVSALYLDDYNFTTNHKTCSYFKVKVLTLHNMIDYLRVMHIPPPPPPLSLLH